MRLPAASVAQARFLLLVDPWITNTLGFGATIVDSDVLREALTPPAGGANTWVAYSLEVAANDNDVFVRRLDYEIWKLGYRGRVVETFTVTPPVGAALEPGGATFDRDGREFLLVDGNNDGSAAGNSLIGAVMSYDAVPAPRTFGFGCGAGSIGGLGAMATRQQIGAEGLRFYLDNAPVNGVAFALLSLGGANLPLGSFGLPGCDLLVDPDPARYVGIVVAPVVGGRGSFSLDLVETLAPFRLAVQWFYPAPGANPAGLLAADGLDLTVGR